MDWRIQFDRFAKSQYTFHNFVLAIRRMRLFPSWARMYWARTMWKQRDTDPLTMLREAPFVSFFCGGQRDDLFLMQLWGSVHMAHFLLTHQDPTAFMCVNQFKHAQYFFCDIAPWTADQGDWKCAVCGDTVDGCENICLLCSAPIKDWVHRLHGPTAAAPACESSITGPCDRAPSTCDR